MKILAVADEPSPRLLDRVDYELWRDSGIDLIVSCGDLSIEYLDFLSDAVRVPLFYVRGNHDDQWRGSPGGEDLHGRILTYKGLRLLGLEGSPRYNDKPYQYTETQVALRLKLMTPQIWLSHGVDVVVAHAAPLFCQNAYKVCSKPIGVGRDCPYLPPKLDGHRGFAAYRDFILAVRPKLFIHGHRHRTYGLAKQIQTIGETRVVDALDHVIVEV
jgi:Icc-related predicted phosphoesterase